MKYTVTVVGEITEVFEVECEDRDDAKDAGEVAFAKWLKEHPDNLWKYVDAYEAQDGIEWNIEAGAAHE